MPPNGGYVIHPRICRPVDMSPRLGYVACRAYPPSGGYVIHPSDMSPAKVVIYAICDASLIAHFGAKSRFLGVSGATLMRREPSSRVTQGKGRRRGRGDRHGNRGSTAGNKRTTKGTTNRRDQGDGTIPREGRRTTNPQMQAHLGRRRIEGGGLAIGRQMIRVVKYIDNIQGSQEAGR